MSPLRRLVASFRRARARGRLRRAAHRELDRLFNERPKLLAGARLSPRHRGRLNVLEVDGRGSRIERILAGIVRHPKAHPLAPRGEEVLELIEYRPQEGTLKNVGARNLTRRPVRP